MKKWERHTFTAEFKKQMIQLHQNGKTKRPIISEHDLSMQRLLPLIASAVTAR